MSLWGTIGAICAIGGAAISIVDDIASKKEMEEEIDRRIDERLSLNQSEEDEDEEE